MLVYKSNTLPFILTDTDSFIYEIKTDCYYTDMKRHLERYDTSDFPPDNIFGIPLVNKKIPGLFKDELNSHIMTEFVGLRSKMYSIKADQVLKSKVGDDRIKKAIGVEKMKKAKGVKKYVLEKEITFDDCSIVKSQNSIRSKMHTVYSVRQKKVALSPFDNKRFILENKIDTIPWGHYSIRNKLITWPKAKKN